MALPASGRISSTAILEELGYTSSDRLESTVRTEGGRRQVKVNGNWINLNSCSPSLPKSTPPHTGSDWYNYNHSTGSIITATISGNTTIYTGTSHVYTCSYTSDGATGVTYNWNAGSYGSIVSGQGTNTVTINFNFTNPYESQSSNVVCIVSSDCGDRGSNTLSVSPIVSYNSPIAANFYKNDCSTCFAPNPYFVSISYGAYRSYDFNGQSIVDGQANNDAQNQANNNGSCYYTGVELSFNAPTYGGSLSSDNGVRPTDFIEIYVSGNTGMVEFSFDMGSWYDANLSNHGYGMVRTADGGNTTIYARQKGSCTNTISYNIGHRMTYGNPAISGSMPKNDCPSGWTPTNGSYNVAGNYYWRSNQSDSDLISWSIAQMQANSNGSCNPPVCPEPWTPIVTIGTVTSGVNMTVSNTVHNWNGTDEVLVDTRSTNSLNPANPPCGGWSIYYSPNSAYFEYSFNTSSPPCPYVRTRIGFKNSCSGTIVWSSPQYLIS